MGTYRKEWDCCGSVTETEAWEPERCPFCTDQAAQPLGAGSSEGLGLAPERAGQPRFYTATGPVPEAGHWYSPAAVRELLAEDRERQKPLLRECEMVLQALLDVHEYPPGNATVGRLQAALSGPNVRANRPSGAEQE